MERIYLQHSARRQGVVLCSGIFRQNSPKKKLSLADSCREGYNTFDLSSFAILFLLLRTYVRVFNIVIHFYMIVNYFVEILYCILNIHSLKIPDPADNVYPAGNEKRTVTDQ